MTDNTTWNNSDEGDPDSIQTQRMVKAIRLRPSMFIGSCDLAGLHSLVYELIEYGLTEFSTGHGKSIHVRINADSSLSVADDGRGIPIEVDARTQTTILEWVMTHSTKVEVHGGERAFRTSLHGVGARAITALSDWSEATVCREGRVYRQRYERGLPVADVCDIGPAGARTGTTITFHPDPTIFPNIAFDRACLEARLRELAFLNKGLVIRLTEEQTGRETRFHFLGGVVEFVEYLNRGAEVLHEPIYGHETLDDFQAEIAMQYTAGKEERIRCYANNAYNRGGTHRRGFRSALTRTLNRFGREENLWKGGLVPNGADFREGLTAIVRLRVLEPQFESRNKFWLGNPEAEIIVARVVRKELARFLKENAEEARRITRKAIAAAKARKTKMPPKVRKSGGPPK